MERHARMLEAVAHVRVFEERRAMAGLAANLRDSGHSAPSQWNGGCGQNRGCPARTRATFSISAGNRPRTGARRARRRHQRCHASFLNRVEEADAVRVQPVCQHEPISGTEAGVETRAEWASSDSTSGAGFAFLHASYLEFPCSPCPAVPCADVPLVVRTTSRSKTRQGSVSLRREQCGCRGVRAGIRGFARGHGRRSH